MIRIDFKRIYSGKDIRLMKISEILEYGKFIFTVESQIIDNASEKPAACLIDVTGVIFIIKSDFEAHRNAERLMDKPCFLINI